MAAAKRQQRFRLLALLSLRPLPQTSARTPRLRRPGKLPPGAVSGSPRLTLAMAGIESATPRLSQPWQHCTPTRVSLLSLQPVHLSLRTVNSCEFEAPSFVAFPVRYHDNTPNRAGCSWDGFLETRNRSST